jgi:hypothetical protein
MILAIRVKLKIMEYPITLIYKKKTILSAISFPKRVTIITGLRGSTPLLIIKASKTSIQKVIET